jgi:peptide/nickel transport system substrate-binding protein
LVFGLEGETPDGWNPATTQCAVACHTVMRAVFDPLTIEDDSGATRPYLLESFEANDDFTVWTLRMRPGIMFHDGTPADANALATHFGALQAGALTGQVMRAVEGWTVIDDLTLEVHNNRPFAGLPDLLTGQMGYLAAPSQHADPDGAANPVGTGPFVFNSWIPNTEFVADRNPDYWKTDAAGRQLPYLDRVVFRPIPDATARRLSLEAGDLDVHHVNDPLTANENRENHKVVEEGSFFQTTYMMLNNSQPPFDDIRARRAVAHCTDYETYNLLRAGGNAPIANGPFGPNTPGYLADTGYPTYDPEAGQALWNQLDNPVTVELGTTNNPVNLITTELLAQMWNDCGIDTVITQVDQGTLILNAVFGSFQAFLWRNHNGSSLEAERVWWHSEYASGLAINFGRVLNPRIDAALDGASRTTDRDELRTLAEEVNRAFADEVHNIWLGWSLWMLPHFDGVRNLGLLTLPDGREVLNLIEGRAFITETWIE